MSTFAAPLRRGQQALLILCLASCRPSHRVTERLQPAHAAKTAKRPSMACIICHTFVRKEFVTVVAILQITTRDTGGMRFADSYVVVVRFASVFVACLVI